MQSIKRFFALTGEQPDRAKRPEEHADSQVAAEAMTTSLAATDRQRGPLSSLSLSSPLVNGCQAAKRRRLSHVAIPKSERRSQSSEYLRHPQHTNVNASQRRTQRRTQRPKTKAPIDGARVPAWKRLGLELRTSETAPSQTRFGDTVVGSCGGAASLLTTKKAGPYSIPSAENASDGRGALELQIKAHGESVPQQAIQSEGSESLKDEVKEFTRTFGRRIAMDARPAARDRGAKARKQSASNIKLASTTRSERLSVAHVLPESPLSEAECGTKKTVSESQALQEMNDIPASSRFRPRRSMARLSYAETGSIGDDNASLSERDIEPDGSDYAEAGAGSSDEDPSVVSDAMVDDEEELDDQDNDPDVSDQDGRSAIMHSSPERPQKKTASRSRASNHRADEKLDFNLPPLSNVEDIFVDMVRRAIPKGLGSATEELRGREIHVATMCSGTESPLIALQLVSAALEQLGHEPIVVNHHFSAEIDVIKQGFIERNFGPKILFRDVTDFRNENSTTATTAYGAEARIPGDLDLLIAGFVCKDLSRLNRYAKTLADEGESGDTWNSVYTYTKRFRPSIVLLENVKSTPKLWNAFEALWAEIGYTSTWMYCDTKEYYLPQTRQRMYMIAINKDLFKGAKEAVKTWGRTMGELKRACSSPFESFFSQYDFDEYNHVNKGTEVDWALCKIRNDNYRADNELGSKRPLTHWTESGTVNPPDFADHAWYKSRSTRETDAIDIAHLHGCKDGHDSLYKMISWDVSQNVDRFKSAMGIVSCITPDGCVFVTSKQSALNGSQLLLLQGMPYDKLLLGQETQKELQDLAGNAMSTTVIGASIISAIICGWRSFRSGHSGMSIRTQPEQAISKSLISLKPQREPFQLAPQRLNALDLKQLLDDARRSSRLCNCEGARRISKASVQICKACGHTACSACSGNPKHSYHQIIQPVYRPSPGKFELRWRPELPFRLNIRNFPRLASLDPELYKQNGLHQDVQAKITEANLGSETFSIGAFQRKEQGWKVSYAGKHASLELHLGIKAYWHVKITVPASLPANDALRSVMSQPIARGVLNRSILDVTWEVNVPEQRKIGIAITPSSEMVPSYRQRIGLLRSSHEKIPMKLNVSMAPSVKGVQEICGEYELQTRCGTAMNCLYKKLADDPLYLFLDPKHIGPGHGDSFVFSTDIFRKTHDDPRMSLAKLDASWRPWALEAGEATTVEATVLGNWVPSNMSIKDEHTPITVGFPSAQSISKHHFASCNEAIVALDVHVATTLSTNHFPEFSWALERARLEPEFDHWIVCEALCGTNTCPCSPRMPTVEWSIGRHGDATMHENRQQAAEFERAMKLRPPIVEIQASSYAGKKNTHIRIGLRIASLIHRAKSRLPSRATCSTAWRLVKSHTTPANTELRRFKLKDNSDDEPYNEPLGLQHPLFESQRRSLAWMKRQERGVHMKITETEEYVHEGLSWRVEARAQQDVTIYGGILADLPSFGKTITSIGLISSEFEDKSMDEVLHANNAVGKLDNLIDLAATIIVAPSTLARQWKEEFNKFLEPQRLRAFEILLIETFADLQELCINHFLQAKVVIISWTLLAEEAYVSHLARFSAMPEPSATEGRPFDAWMDMVDKVLPERITELQTSGITAFEDNIKHVLSDRLKQPTFQATIPQKPKHGAKYISYNQQAATKRAPAAATKLKDKASASHVAQGAGEWSSYKVPLLQLFKFNRIVVDEYHYLTEATEAIKTRKGRYAAYSSIKRLAAVKRWALSGTPALATFEDVNYIASLLGVSLGHRFSAPRDAQARDLKAEKSMLGERTGVEKFLSSIELRSYWWHHDRHARAQEFLNLFMRQNAPYLEDILCKENLRPIQLDIAHKAIYLELAQHLALNAAQRSQVRQAQKRKETGRSDRIQRLNNSLNDSATPEEALVNCALTKQLSGHGADLDSLIERREMQVEETKSDLLDLLRQAERNQHFPWMRDHYRGFKTNVKNGTASSDGEAHMMLERLLKEASKDATKAKKLKSETDVKKVAGALHFAVRELTSRARSLRYLNSINKLYHFYAMPDGSSRLVCDANGCPGSKVNDLFLSSTCGHLICKYCRGAVEDSETCRHPGCAAALQDATVFSVRDLRFDEASRSTTRVGKKLDTLVDCIDNIPEHDQAVVFVPNEKALPMLETVLTQRQVPYYAIARSKQTSKYIEDFKKNKDADKKKVLILNLLDESAAGLNLTNANHIFFATPLLAESQHKYDSSMAQAIARCRRYGQEKPVYVYHFVALRTIDVDILEHRHRRVDAIGDNDIQGLLPPSVLTKKEKTRLIRNDAGSTALVPVSWLSQDDKLQALNVVGPSEEIDQFTSSINFSKTFIDDDDV